MGGLGGVGQRGGDAALLAGVFLGRFAARHRRSVKGFSPDAASALAAHGWHGNVRELENVVERAVLMEDGEQISLGSLPDAVVEVLHGGGARAAEPGAGAGRAAAARVEDIRPLEDEERRIILRALDATGWNIQEAAARLGISRATIYRKIERYGIAPGGARAGGPPGAGAQ